MTDNETIKKCIEFIDENCEGGYTKFMKLFNIDCTFHLVEVYYIVNEKLSHRYGNSIRFVYKKPSTGEIKRAFYIFVE